MRGLIIVLLILLGAWIAWHPIEAEAQKNNPPLSCQLWGGTWNIWSGWNCS